MVSVMDASEAERHEIDYVSRRLAQLWVYTIVMNTSSVKVGQGVMLATLLYESTVWLNQCSLT